MMNIPVGITCFRLFMAVFIMPEVIWWSVQNSSLVAHACAGLLSIVVCFTDFLDGYYARRLHLVTRFGAFLDHFADKLFITTSLIVLTVAGKIPLWCALIMVVREMCVMGLREYSVESGMILPVQQLGKWKMLFQYAYISTVIGAVRLWHPLGVWLELLCGVGAVSLTIISMIQYSFQLLRYVSHKP